MKIERKDLYYWRKGYSKTAQKRSNLSPYLLQREYGKDPERVQ